jgi:hypothetical protein
MGNFFVAGSQSTPTTTTTLSLASIRMRGHPSGSSSSGTMDSIKFVKNIEVMIKFPDPLQTDYQLKLEIRNSFLCLRYPEVRRGIRLLHQVQVHQQQKSVHRRIYPVEKQIQSVH